MDLNDVLETDDLSVGVWGGLWVNPDCKVNVTDVWKEGRKADGIV